MPRMVEEVADREEGPGRRRRPAHRGDVEAEHEQAHDQHRGRRIARRDLALEQPVDRDRADRDPDREDGEEQAGDRLVGGEHVLHQRRELDEQHRADRPEEADRDDGEVEARDVQGGGDQPDRGAHDVEIDDMAVVDRRRGGHPAPAPIADQRDQDHRAGRGLDRDHAGEQGPAQDRDIGAGLDQAGAAEHFVGARAAGAGSHI